MISKLDGRNYLAMVNAGAKVLASNMSVVNDLNVFPVPDGDTGTNMLLTIDGGVKGITDDSLPLDELSKLLARQMVFNARGNSGVILSQYFKGLSNGFKGHQEVDVKEFVEALGESYKKAYSVVQNPTEGTMLTVMREAAEKVKLLYTEKMSFSDVLKIYLREAKDSLDRTPQLLKVLMDAGVVDSGGTGLVFIIEGMLKYINGESIEDVNIDNVFEKPLYFKAKSGVRKDYAIVAVANGEGLIDAFKEMGVDIVLTGGQTMNTSTKDFMDAFKSLNADVIYVYPNNGNIKMAAQMAADEFKDSKVVIVPTKTLAQGYSAVSMFEFNKDSDVVLNSQIEIIENLSTLEVTFSVRETTLNDIKVSKGDFIAIYDDELISASRDRLECLKKAFDSIDISSKSVVSILMGEDSNEEEVNAITAYIQELNSFIEVYPIKTNQQVYSYIMGVE